MDFSEQAAHEAAQTPPCPLFVLTPEDTLAVFALRFYADQYGYTKGATPEGRAKLDALIKSFHTYEHQHPDRCHVPIIN